jgi:hypothetical protein
MTRDVAHVDRRGTVPFDVSRFVMAMAASLIDRNIGLTSDEIKWLRSSYAEEQFLPKVLGYCDGRTKGLIKQCRRGRPQRSTLPVITRVEILADYREKLRECQEHDNLLSPRDRKHVRENKGAPSSRALDHIRSKYRLNGGNEALRNRLSDWWSRRAIRALVDRVLRERQTRP